MQLRWDRQQAEAAEEQSKAEAEAATLRAKRRKAKAQAAAAAAAAAAAHAAGQGQGQGGEPDLSSSVIVGDAAVALGTGSLTGGLLNGTASSTMCGTSGMEGGEGLSGDTEGGAEPLVPPPGPPMPEYGGFVGVLVHDAGAACIKVRRLSLCKVWACTVYVVAHTAHACWTLMHTFG